MSIYETGLKPRPANHTPLTPLSLFRRTAAVYPDRVATRYGGQKRTWGEMARRVAAFAERLKSLGIGRDDTVAVFAPNTPAALEMARYSAITSIGMRATTSQTPRGTIIKSSR